MTSVCIVSPAWGRFDVTRLVLEQRRRVCEELASRGVDAGMMIAADDENLDIAGEFGCDTLEIQNGPLGAKCNALLHTAADTGVDWLVWIGSDDWLHPSIFDALLDREPRTDLAMIFSGHRLAIVDMSHGHLQRLQVKGPYGAIPWILEARVLRDAIRRRNGDRMGPIEPTAKRGLDGYLVRGLRRCRVPFGWHYSDPSEFRCVDFKTRTNVTPFDGLAKNLGVGDPEPAWATLRKEFPPDLVTKARKLSERLKGASA